MWEFDTWPHYADRATDRSEFLDGGREAFIHELQGGLTAELDVALLEFLHTMASARNLAAEDDEASARAGVHDVLRRAVASAAEEPAAFERRSEAAGHDLCV